MKSEFDSPGAPRAPQDAGRHASVSPRLRTKSLTIVGFASKLGGLVGDHLATSLEGHSEQDDPARNSLQSQNLGQNG